MRAANAAGDTPVTLIHFEFRSLPARYPNRAARNSQFASLQAHESLRSRRRQPAALRFARAVRHHVHQQSRCVTLVTLREP